MPKLKWGGDEFLSSLEDDTQDSGRTEYTGPDPKIRLVYGWKINQIKAGRSSGGHKQLVLFCELEPHLPEHEKYRGFFSMQFLTLPDDGRSNFRLRPLLKALEVTPREFVNNLIVSAEKDERGQVQVTKIGKVTIGGNKVLGKLVPQKGNDYYDIQFVGPWPDNAGSSDASGAEDEAGGDDDSNEPDPF